jgi:hypothetical protein
LVSGDFWQTYNMIACISGNPLKQKHAVFMIGEDNRTSASFKKLEIIQDYLIWSSE